MYRMLDLNTKKVKMTRYMIWLNKPYVIWKGKKEVEDYVDVEDNIDQEVSDEGIIEEEKISDSPCSEKKTNEFRRLNTLYNQTIEDILEFAMVGGTDNEYVNLISFQGTWWHPDPEERRK